MAAHLAAAGPGRATPAALAGRAGRDQRPARPVSRAPSRVLPRRLARARAHPPGPTPDPAGSRPLRRLRAAVSRRRDLRRREPGGDPGLSRATRASCSGRESAGTGSPTAIRPMPCQLRSVAEGNFVVIDTTDGGQTVIAEVDYSSAPGTLYEGAIYMIQSQPYQVERLDWVGRKAFVTRTRADYYTDAIDYTRLKILDRFEGTASGEAPSPTARCIWCAAIPATRRSATTPMTMSATATSICRTRKCTPRRSGGRSTRGRWGGLAGPPAGDRGVSRRGPCAASCRRAAGDGRAARSGARRGRRQGDLVRRRRPGRARQVRRSAARRVEAELVCGEFLPTLFLYDNYPGRRRSVRAAVRPARAGAPGARELVEHCACTRRLPGLHRTDPGDDARRAGRPRRRRWTSSRCCPPPHGIDGCMNLQRTPGRCCAGRAGAGRSGTGRTRSRRRSAVQERLQRLRRGQLRPTVCSDERWPTSGRHAPSPPAWSAWSGFPAGVRHADVALGTFATCPGLAGRDSRPMRCCFSTPKPRACGRHRHRGLPARPGPHRGRPAAGTAVSLTAFAGEPALLEPPRLARRNAQCLVTFNGKSFDCRCSSHVTAWRGAQSVRTACPPGPAAPDPCGVHAPLERLPAADGGAPAAAFRPPQRSAGPPDTRGVAASCCGQVG